jgi:chemotaxis protein MotB
LQKLLPLFGLQGKYKDRIEMANKPPPQQSSPSDASKWTDESSVYWNASETDSPLSYRTTSKTMHWSIPWSDLMMTMFILFVILYIYHASKDEVSPRNDMVSTVDMTAAPDTDGAFGDQGGFQGTLKESMSNIYDLSRQTVKAHDLEAFASVDLVPNKAVRIVLAADLLFDTGRADLRPEAAYSLRRIAGILRQTPYVVNVVGHTDDVPIHSEKFPSNWELSALRACKVVRFLVDEAGLPGKRFFISGHAYHQPIAVNSSAKTRAANRRVEVIITKEKPGRELDMTENTAALGLPKKDPRSTREVWPWNTF